MRAEDFIIGKVGTLEPKKGETSTRQVRVLDVGSNQVGITLKVVDVVTGLNPQWVMAYRVNFTQEEK